VDDSEAILDRVTTVLAPRCSIIGAVTDGVTALKAAASLHPDVIVLDISMPGMSGLEVAASLRDAGSTAAVVFLSVHEDEDLMQAARKVGGVAYISKPHLMIDLVPAVMHAGEHGEI